MSIYELEMEKWSRGRKFGAEARARAKGIPSLQGVQGVPL